MTWLIYLAAGWPLLAVVTAIVIGRLEFRVKRDDSSKGVLEA